MDQDDSAIYVKLGRDGDVIERVAATPSDHVQFKGTGWVRKDSSLGRQVTGQKKSSAERQPATSVTAHAAAARTGDPSSSDAATGSKAVGSKPAAPKP